MRIVKVGEEKTMTPPRHHELFARLFYNGEKITVGRIWMSAFGGAEMDSHDSEHIFYILRGSAKMFNGKDTFFVEEGDSIIVEPGEPHSLTGNGKVDCEYIVITSPPLG